jgi:hypothetical protein
MGVLCIKMDGCASGRVGCERFTRVVRNSCTPSIRPRMISKSVRDTAIAVHRNPETVDSTRNERVKRESAYGGVFVGHGRVRRSSGGRRRGRLIVCSTRRWHIRCGRRTDNNRSRIRAVPCVRISRTYSPNTGRHKSKGTRTLR